MELAEELPRAVGVRPHRALIAGPREGNRASATVVATLNPLLADLLRAQLDRALHAAYPWYPSPHDGPVSAVRGEAKPSDWRAWDWD